MVYGFWQARFSFSITDVQISVSLRKVGLRGCLPAFAVWKMAKEEEQIICIVFDQGIDL